MLFKAPQVLERPAVAEGAGHRGFIRRRDRAALDDLQILLTHLHKFAQAPPDLFVRARLAKIQLFDFAFAFGVVFRGVVPVGRVGGYYGDIRGGSFLLRVGLHGSRSGDGFGGGSSSGGVRALAGDVFGKIGRLVLRHTRFRHPRLIPNPRVGLVVKRRHAVVRVQVHHPRFPPRPVVRPKDVDVSSNQRQLRRVLRLQHARNLGALQHGRRLVVILTGLVLLLVLLFGGFAVRARGVVFRASRTPRAPSLRESGDQRGVHSVLLVRGLAVHMRRRFHCNRAGVSGDREGGNSRGRSHRLRRRARSARRGLRRHFHRCAHHGRRGDAVHAEVSTQESVPARSIASSPGAEGGLSS